MTSSPGSTTKNRCDLGHHLTSLGSEVPSDASGFTSPRMSLAMLSQPLPHHHQNKGDGIRNLIYNQRSNSTAVAMRQDEES